MFKVIDRISNSSPNALVNEDAVGATSAGAWVIDGATGVSDRPPLVAGTTDAAWLAGQLNAELQATLDRPDVDPVASMIKVEATIRAAFIAIDRGSFHARKRTAERGICASGIAGKDFASDRDSGLPDHL